MEILNKIMMLYSEIKNIYLKLYNLEKDKNVIDDELIDVLKNKINEEEFLVRELFNYYSDNVYNVYNLIVDNDMKKRLMDSLNIYECINGDISLSKDEMLEQMRIDRLYISCYRSMNLIYYSFLQDYIKSYMFGDIRNSLLKIKYDNSYNNHDMESQLVNNNFIVPMVNYVILNIVVGTLKIENNDLLLDCFAERILTSIIDILKVSDLDYNSNDKKVLSINSQCILRAGLVMINDIDYEELSDEINDIINRYTKDDNKISVEIINSIIKDKNKDRERVRRLSLRPLCE